MKLETIDTPPTLAAGRFDLRPPRASDAGLLAHYAGDERVARNTSSIPHPLPPGTVEAFLTRVTAPDRTETVWIIDGSRDGGEEVMGAIGLKRVDEGQCEIGYWVAHAFWNTGVASEAVGAIVATNPCKCRTIFASVFQDNPVSARVVTNHGFSYLGDAETFSVARNAKVPTWTYSRKMD